MKLKNIIERSMETFKSKLEENCEESNFEELTVTSAEEFTEALKESLAEAGKKAFKEFVESHDKKKE